MLDTDHMAATRDVKTSHNPFLEVDAVGEAMHRVVLLVNFGKDVTTN